MATIEYFGITPEAVELVNSQKFQDILKAYPHLRLVTSTYEDSDEEVFTETTLPLAEDSFDYIGLEDRNNPDSFMWVLYDDYAHVDSPSPAFIEILKLMDAFSIKTLQARLFVSGDGGFVGDSEEILAAEFDFSTGKYVL